MEDLAYWLKAVHAMCPSNTQANADSLGVGSVGQGRVGHERVQSMGVVAFAFEQQLELGEARLLRLAKTLYRLSGVPTPNASLARVPSVSSVPSTRCFEDFFLKDPCA